MIKKTTLFSKILSIAGLIIFGATLILISSIYVQWKLREQSMAKDIQLDLLDAQRRLSNFQFTSDLSEIDSINQIHISIQKAVMDFGEDADLAPISETTEDFFGEFEELVALTVQRGINEDSGMEGAFRDAIHRVQNRVKKLNMREAETLLLEIRRREKDFIMRKDTKYIDLVMQRSSELIDLVNGSGIASLDKQEIINDIVGYRDKFVSLAEATKQISERYQKLNMIVNELQDLGAVLNNNKSEKAKIAQIIIISLMGIILVITIGLSLWFSKKISDPIAELKAAANELALGNLDVDVKTANTRDEVYELSRSFQEMVRQIKHRTDELLNSNSKLILLNTEITDQQKVLAKQAAEIEKNNEMLHNQNDSLERMVIEKNELLGIVSHDLKNPLQSIKLAAQLLKTDGSLSKVEVSEFSSDILNSAARMFDLIKNLLDANAVEEGSVQVSLGAFDAQMITNSVISSYEHKATAKNIVLERSYPDFPVFLHGDSSLTIQILDNLISNAVKYSPYDTRIDIKVDVDIESGKGRVMVIDQGPGLSEEDQKKLFMKYTKLTPEPTAGEHSTGLGLSIVKKLAEIMNGKVWCNSKLGEGSTFVFELPLSKDFGEN